MMPMLMRKATRNRNRVGTTHPTRRMIMGLRILLVLVAAMTMTMGGCTKKSEPTAPAEVKVTAENLDSELDKMEAAIEADIAAE